MSENFKIHLQGSSDTQAWLKAEGDLKRLDDKANKFIDSLKQGVGIDLGGRIVDSVAELPKMFADIVGRGFEFNASMAQAEGGIANVLAKFMKLDAAAAKQEAAKAMAAITEWEPKAAGSLQDLTGGFMSTVGAAQSAGISVAQNVELVGKFANALAALGMDASQLTQELRAIFTGNITSDAQLAKTLEITPEAIRSAKEAGNLYEYLNKQIGSLGETAAGPSVVLSSMSSAVDKAAGILAKPMFDEVIDGAEELTVVLDNPAIKSGLAEAGVSIGELVAQGVNLSVWALQNAPLLIKVAEGAIRVGAALAGIQLASIIAGLALKAQRWATVTAAVSANTAALGANTTAAVANAAAPAVAGGSAAAGAAGGAAAGKAWAGGFGNFMRGAGSLIVLADLMWLMDSAAKFMALKGEAAAGAAADSKRLLDPKLGGDMAPTEYLRDQIETASNPQDVEAARKLGEIMRRDAEAQGNETLVNGINAVMGAFDRLVGTRVDHSKALADAKDAEDQLSAAMIRGQAAAGESGAKLKLASEAVETLAQKIAKAAGGTLDTSSFESLLKGLEGLDKATLGADAAKDVEKLIKLAGELRDLKADAAKEAEQQAAKAKSDAEELIQKQIEMLEMQARLLTAAGHAAAARNAQAQADMLKLQSEGMTPEQAKGVVQAEGNTEREAEAERLALVRQVADLEDKIVKARAAGDEIEEAHLADTLRALQLARQMEEDLKLSRPEAEKRAMDRVNTEREGVDRQSLQDEFHSGKYERRRGGITRTVPKTGLGSDNSGLRGDGTSSIEAHNERQKTRLRDTFEFPRLDAFNKAQQPQTPGAGGVTPQGAQGGEGSAPNAAASAAKQAADAAAKLLAAEGKKDQATATELRRLATTLEQLATKVEQISSQAQHGGDR